MKGSWGESAGSETNNAEDADSSTGITEEQSAVSLIVREQKCECQYHS